MSKDTASSFLLYALSALAIVVVGGGMLGLGSVLLYGDTPEPQTPASTLTPETMAKFHRELEASIRTQHAEEQATLESHGTALARIENAIAGLDEKLAGQPAAPAPTVPQVEPAVQAAPVQVDPVQTPAPAAPVLTETPVLLYSQPVQRQQTTVRYYSGPQRRVFSRQIFRGNCVNGVCPN